MDKNNEIKLVRQPIFKQILDLSSITNPESVIKKHNADYYYKYIEAKMHLRTMLFSILSHCDLIGKICESQREMDSRHS